MKNTLKIAVLLLAALALPVFAFGQVGTALTGTTLSANIGQGQSCFILASVTGISGFGPGINNSVGGTSAGTGNITDLYVDRELMQVVNVNTTAKQVCVLRGQGGSQASAHASGVLVIIGPPGAFFNFDPEGLCGVTVSGSSTPQQQFPPFTPWINQRTSAQWLCSTVTNTWVPGFGNPGISGTPQTLSAAQTGATITPAGPFFNFTGTTALVTMNLPATAPNGTAVTIVFTGSGAGLTWTAAGNIAVAGTATTANSSVTFVFSAATSKWIPSRLA